jgi:hypothetical protein
MSTTKSEAGSTSEDTELVADAEAEVIEAPYTREPAARWGQQLTVLITCVPAGPAPSCGGAQTAAKGKQEAR